jgi:LysM repeat protein
VANGETSPEPAPSSKRSRFWVWTALVVVVVALVGGALGLSLGSRGGPLGSQGGGNGRPAIVVPTPGAAAALSAVPSPSAVPSSVVAGASPQPSAATQYVVQPGDTLRSIALDQYGDAEMWQTIYQANRGIIGPNPDALVAGTTLQIPARQ